MQNEISMRDYDVSDYEMVIALWDSIGLGGQHRGDNQEIIEQTLQSGGRLLLMEIKESSEIVGTSWLTVDGRRTYIHHFGIANSWQGKGLSKPLLEASMALARKIGLQVKLEVHRSNEKAVNLYKKAGFTYLGDYDVYIIRDISTAV